MEQRTMGVCVFISLDVLFHAAPKQNAKILTPFAGLRTNPIIL